MWRFTLLYFHGSKDKSACSVARGELAACVTMRHNRPRHSTILTLVISAPAKTIHLRLLFDARRAATRVRTLVYPFQRISSSVVVPRARHSRASARRAHLLYARRRFTAPHLAFETSINLSGARRPVRGTCQTGTVPRTSRTLPRGRPVRRSDCRQMSAVMTTGRGVVSAR